jgi:hypothetical protein
MKAEICSNLIFVHNYTRFESETKRIEKGIKKLDLITTHSKFKVGQIITFISGYYDNICYKSRITGFDIDGGIYVLWDCYWFPIRDEPIREIKILN